MGKRGMRPNPLTDAAVNAKTACHKTALHKTALYLPGAICQGRERNDYNNCRNCRNRPPAALSANSSALMRESRRNGGGMVAGGPEGDGFCCRVITGDALAVIPGLPGDMRFDVVIADPP